MNDCPKIEFRDRLPELVHERLSAEERAVVMAHVEECADCRAEFELLVGMRAVLAAGVGAKVNVERIVQSLPLSNQHRGSSVIGGRRFAGWQLAAAAAVLLVGGASLATYHTRHSAGSPAIADSPGVVAVNAAGQSHDSALNNVETVAVAPPVVSEQELAVGGGLSDLTSTDLTHLLSEIERLEPMPQTEPDVGTVSTEAPGDTP